MSSTGGRERGRGRGRGYFRRRYGASPAHLLLLLCSFALALYAGLRLFEGDALGVALWFFGAAVVHDLVLLPLYAAADRAAQALAARRGGRDRGTHIPWINHVRVPVFVSGLLLLVWFPLILRTAERYEKSTALPVEVFLGRWLLITAGLFAASAAVLAVRTAWAGHVRQGGRKPM